MKRAPLTGPLFLPTSRGRNSGVRIESPRGIGYCLVIDGMPHKLGNELSALAA